MIYAFRGKQISMILNYRDAGMSGIRREYYGEKIPFFIKV
jgi:hypothetical protein